MRGHARRPRTGPLAAHRDLFLDDKGRSFPISSLNGPLAAGIPGVPAALVNLAEHYGRLPLAATLAPAIRLARDGFDADAYRRSRMAAPPCAPPGRARPSSSSMARSLHSDIGCASRISRAPCGRLAS